MLTIPCCKLGSPEVAASHHLLWHLLILAVIPVVSYVRCYGSKGVVQADTPITAVRALSPSCSACNNSCPDVWQSSWALVALPHNLEVTLWLDPDRSPVHVPLNISFLD